jgi:hypothetical protein
MLDLLHSDLISPVLTNYSTQDNNRFLITYRIQRLICVSRKININRSMHFSVVVMALRYIPEGRWFDTR